jgi:deoxyribonuclease-4
MAKLNFGTGGIPLSTTSRNTEDGIIRARELGLDHMELEFVHGVRINETKAKEIDSVRKAQKISLSVHGPYYINLASENNKTFYGSIGQIVDSVRIGGIAGASSVTFHPAFYQKKSAEETFQLVKKALNKINEEFDNDKFKNHPIKKGLIKVAPELTGKPSQFGDLEELLRLITESENVNLSFCFDFAHKFARSNGKFNTYEEFVSMLDMIESEIGRKFLDSLHIHVSAILHSEKGERNHVTMLPNYQEYREAGIDVEGFETVMAKLEEKGKTIPSKFNWKDLLRALKDKSVGGFLVCESPNLELDALLMQSYYANL